MNEYTVHQIVTQDVNTRKICAKRVPARESDFSVLQCPDRLWGSPRLLFNRYSGLSQVVKLPRCEVDHTPPSSAEVKNSGTIPPLPHMFYGILFN
jgi:hypothetical protein